MLEDAHGGSLALHGFAGIELMAGAVRDTTTALRFRHWVEQHGLTKVLFDEIGAVLAPRGLLMRQGTIVNTTNIAAPSSTANTEKARDPETHQTRKGNRRYFRMKA